MSQRDHILIISLNVALGGLLIFTSPLTQEKAIEQIRQMHAKTTNIPRQGKKCRRKRATKGVARMAVEAPVS
jgi:hypothetical protein